MSKVTFFYIVAAILLAMIPIVPKMIALRIRVLRGIRWNGVADWHERHIKFLTALVRGFFVVIAVLLVLAAQGVF